MYRFFAAWPWPFIRSILSLLQLIPSLSLFLVLLVLLFSPSPSPSLLTVISSVNALSCRGFVMQILTCSFGLVAIN